MSGFSNIHQIQNLFSFYFIKNSSFLFMQMCCLKSGLGKTTLETLSLFESDAFEVLPLGNISV